MFSPVDSNGLFVAPEIELFHPAGRGNLPERAHFKG